MAGDKSKFMIIGTKRLRSKKNLNEMKITVDGKEIVETASEKLLGVVINNELTWKNHLYGDQDHQGLIPQLSQRLGMLKKMSKYMSRENLKYFSSGIFYSKINYCLPVFGNVFGLGEYKEENSRYQSYTMKDNHNLQVLQNNLNRLLLGANRNTSTKQLIEETDSLSIQQMIAYHTAVLTYKVINSGKPSYLSKRMKRGRSGYIEQTNLRLSISREGFIHRGPCIFNKLDKNLRNEPRIDRFKVALRKWIKENIAIKPSQKFPSLPTRNYLSNQTRRPDAPDPQPNPNSIMRFLVPITTRAEPTPATHITTSRPTPTDRPPPTQATRQIEITRFFSHPTKPPPKS